MDNSESVAVQMALALALAYRGSEADLPRSPFEGTTVSVAVDVPKLLKRIEGIVASRASVKISDPSVDAHSMIPTDRIQGRL